MNARKALMVAIVMPLARILQAHLSVLVRKDLSETEEIARVSAHAPRLTMCG